MHDTLIQPERRPRSSLETHAKRRQRNGRLKHTELQTPFLQALPLHVTLLDSAGVIVSMSDSLLDKSENGGPIPGADLEIGGNYLEACDQVMGALSTKARAVSSGIRRLLKGKAKDLALDYSHESPAGMLWFRIAAGAVDGEHGRGVVILYANITKRKAGVEALVKSDDEFRSMFGAAGTGIATSTPQGQFLRANGAYCRMLGYTEAELRERNFASVTHPDDLPLNLKMRDELLSGRRKSFVMEKRYLKKSGDIVWTRHSVAASHATGGEITTMIVVAEDITERKQAEKSQLLFRTLIDKSNDAIEVVDARTLRLLDVSESACASLGYRREELLGLSVFDINPDITRGSRKRISDILESIGFVTFEARRRRKDGSTFPVEINLKRVQLDRTYDVGVVRDIAQRKDLEQQFLRAQRMQSIGALAGGIAHDLNNILAPIMMSMRVLKDISRNRRAKQILETIEASANRGAEMVRQVLSFARGLEVERTEIKPKSLVDEVSNMIRDTLPTNIRLRIEVPKKTWMILGDPTQAVQLLLNLCLNARDAMPKGGELSIVFENCVLDEHAAAIELNAKPGSYVRIKVTDTGIGMKPEALKRIFEPFYTTKGIGKGTGLGLATASAILKSHQGFINVYSEVGKGSAFKVYLPAVGNRVRARKPPLEKGSPPRGKGETILVVDDEASIRNITQETLQAFGYEVLTAASGRRALSLFSKHRGKIELLLTDISMPGMGGAALVRALTKIEPNLKVIAASGHLAGPALTAAVLSKVNHFLTKPYSAETLLRLVRGTLDGRKATRTSRHSTHG
jgi:PAS domain S-box-containing protein